MFCTDERTYLVHSYYKYSYNKINIGVAMIQIHKHVLSFFVNLVCITSENFKYSYVKKWINFSNIFIDVSSIHESSIKKEGSERGTYIYIYI